MVGLMIRSNFIFLVNKKLRSECHCSTVHEKGRKAPLKYCGIILLKRL
jgi:hypothetical protein